MNRRVNLMKSPNFGNRNLPSRQLSPWITGNESPRMTNNVVDPQAQLALASNLLNNLLNPGQQSSPPSLLSLSNLTSPQGFGGAGSGGMNSMGNMNRFGNLNQGNLGRNRYNQSPRDYGKRDYQGARRFNADQNRNKYQGRRNDQFKNKAVAEKKSGDNSGGNQANSSDDPTVKLDDGTEQHAEGAEGDNEGTGDVSGRTEEGESAEKGEGSANESEHADTVDDYSEIAPCLLYCHICRKHMWDAESFVKHLDGRPHKMMIDELDQTYKLTVQLLRHETRVMEQQRENDIQRAQRKGKTGPKVQQRGFCTMCDLNFLGTLPAHRRNERHQRLKKFLHPKCNICEKEFYTRLEWDDHKLTAGHLKNLHEVRLINRPNIGVTEFDIVDFIEDVNDGVITCSIDLKVNGVRKMYTDEEQKLIDEQKDSWDKSKDDEKDKDDRYPKFVHGTAIGAEFVSSITGSLCRACYRFMPTEEDNKVHLQTQAHYNNVVQLMKIKDRIAPPKTEQEPKVDDQETADSTQEIECAEQESQDSATQDSQEGQNAEEPPTKRAKVDQEDDGPVEDNEPNESIADDNDDTTAGEQMEMDAELDKQAADTAGTPVAAAASATNAKPGRNAKSPATPMPTRGVKKTPPAQGGTTGSARGRRARMK